MSRAPTRTPITGRTGIVGIFGDPVEHSRSPAMHNAAFAALALDYRYVAFHVGPDALAAAVRSIRALRLRGVNLTVPHKERVLRHLDSLSQQAAAVGAVNTIVNRDGHLHGDNTDVFGFVQSLRPYRAQLRKQRAIVVGAGGASRAVLCGLRELGVAQVLLANRTLPRARKLAAQIAQHAPPIRLVGLGDLATEATFDEVALVVNATSLGWRGERFPSIAMTASHVRCLYYDLAYGQPTDFFQKATEARRPTMDGGEMLILQGARAFTLWTRRRAPVAAMRTAFYTKISN